MIDMNTPQPEVEHSRDMIWDEYGQITAEEVSYTPMFSYSIEDLLGDTIETEYNGMEIAPGVNNLVYTVESNN